MGFDIYIYKYVTVSLFYFYRTKSNAYTNLCARSQCVSYSKYDYPQLYEINRSFYSLYLFKVSLCQSCPYNIYVTMLYLNAFLFLALIFTLTLAVPKESSFVKCARSAWADFLSQCFSNNLKYKVFGSHHLASVSRVAILDCIYTQLNVTRFMSIA